MRKNAVVFLIFLMLFLCGCTDNREDGVNDVTQSLTVTQAAKDFLTGEKSNRESINAPRPVAVMINNIEASLPQYGISRADIIMEMPVEGGITRLMAIYNDYKAVPSVCSIRSCRYYFPVFAKGFDAVYFCYGSNELLGTPMLEKCGIDYIDGNKAGDSLIFERDSYRVGIYSPEHTVYLKGENMAEIFDKYGFRKEISPSYRRTAFDFSDTVQKFSFECTGITGSFSTSYSSGFFYDENNSTYLKTHSGKKHYDGKDLNQLEFTNVFLLEAEVSDYKQTNLIELDWHGGKGVYSTMGTMEKITWEKKSESSPIEFFDSKGKPLEINKGKSYIGIGVQDVILSRDNTDE